MNKDNFFLCNLYAFYFLLSYKTWPSHMMFWRTKWERISSLSTWSCMGKPQFYHYVWYELWIFCRIFFIILRKFPSTLIYQVLLTNGCWFFKCLLHLSMCSCIFFFLAYFIILIMIPIIDFLLLNQCSITG